MQAYAGNRWYKCDLHIHTTSSKCYLNKDDTPQQWVDRALEQGLSVAAVTDHNDYRGIAPVIEAAKEQGLTVFPGVEITCDTSKIHILVLFNTDKTAETVRDFLNRCDIDSDLIGKNEGTSLSVFEVCEIARKRGGLVIAAHIDEFNSINSMTTSHLDKLLKGGYLDAVQVTNTKAWREYAATKDAAAMYETLRSAYGPDATPEEIERWRKCFDRAKAAGLPMLSFSDNPSAPGNSKHGLNGIGSVYTWIQMDGDVDLESLRQSFISKDSRIHMMIDSPDEPKTEPDFWIRSLEVRKSSLNPHKPLHLDFHPQLNCIIGGRGSGKSSIVHILSGVYRQLLPGSFLSEEVALQNSIYRAQENNGQGLFSEESEIEIYFDWFGYHYKMLVTDIQSVQDQKYTFSLIDQDDHEIPETELTDLGFLRLMSAQVLIQRQIYELARTPGALLEQIDKLIPDMYILRTYREYLMDKLLVLSQDIRSTQRILKYTPRVSVELDWIEKIEESSVSRDIRENRPARVLRRQNTLARMQKAADELAAAKETRKTLLREYENCLTQIRQERTAFLANALKDDENFKMEMNPFGDHASFKDMMKEVLGADLSMISEDIDKLEAALFAKENGLQKYQKLLTETFDYIDEHREGRLYDIRKFDDASRSKESLSEFSPYFIRMLSSCSELDREKMRLFHPEDELRLFYHPKGVSRFFPMTTASAGEKAEAVLSLMLGGCDKPLVIDQPEEDMDNRMIYEELIPKLKKAKMRRQMILVTHSANIASNADPELVISMDSRNKFTKVRLQGSINTPEIRKEICDVLEGGETAFLQRARKYHL